MKKLLFLVIGLIILAQLGGCSAEKNTVVSKAYHNTTARYNAYWLAKEKMKEIEDYVVANNETNFNKILNIYPQVDSIISNGVQEPIEECIKKASIAIQRHQNSRWVDPSYILVGKARFYNLEYTDAIETFKYVNSKGEDDNSRHEGLIFLMRTFIDYNEHNNAIAVSDYLKKEKLSEENQKNLYLTRAYLYQKREDYDQMVHNLGLAAPLLSRKDGKARLFFIIGQVYQKLGFDSEAYHNYGICLKNNPGYELGFYAKLNRAQVFVLHRKTDVKRVRNYFKKLLKDAKNREFKDKIYYEMAAFEIKQGEEEDAIKFYNLSIRSSITNRRQKALSYLRLGEIFYDNKEFSLSKSYYDSVLMEMPKDEENYLEIEERQQVLSEFVKQLDIIHTQDSLLMLAELDSGKLSAYLDGVILNQEKAEEEKKKKEEEEAIRAASLIYTTYQNPFGGGPGQGSEGDWYFYNISAISIGHSEFVKRWGNRRLEDHWRRRNKESVIEIEEADVTEALAEKEETDTEEVDVESKRASQKQAMYATIPFSPAAKEGANSQIEEAYYHLGNIYNFDLDEKENAVEAFETLITRYQESGYRPEVLYLLYLILKELGDEKYKLYQDELVNKYPHTLYAKLINNPNYRAESQAAAEKLKKIYKGAYALYKSEEYDSARRLIREGLLEFPENDFSDNLRMLEILIIGKTEDIYRYQHSLDQFLEEYSESDLTQYAQTLRQASETYQLELVKMTGNEYIEHFEQTHSFILIYEKENRLTDQIPLKIEEFIDSYFAEKELNTANLVLDGATSMILVDKFKDKKEAMAFYRSFQGTKSPLKEFEFNDFHYFVISKDNFQIFYQLKDYNQYLSFFQKHY